MEMGGQLHSVAGRRRDGQRSSASSELKLLLRLLPLDAAGDPAERSGSVPKGERGSSIRISSSRCSSFKVLQKKSVNRGGAVLAAGGSSAASGDGMKAQLLPLEQPYWADREHEPGFPVPVRDTNRKVG